MLAARCGRHEASRASQTQAYADELTPQQLCVNTVNSKQPCLSTEFAGVTLWEVKDDALHWLDTTTTK